MSYYTVRQAHEAAERSGALTASAAERQIKEAATGSRKAFDIFLSHSYADMKAVFGIKTILEDQGKSVYVDWIEDPGFDRSNVTAETAATLRERLRSCRSLIFVTSESSSTSKWMPWELGFFDGRNGATHIAILPIVPAESSRFVGQEYLGLYPLIQRLHVPATDRYRPFVTRVAGGTLEYRNLDSLVTGTDTYRRVQ